MSGYDYTGFENAYEGVTLDEGTTDSMDINVAVYTDAVFTTWSDDLSVGSPTELEQWVMDNYSDSTLGIGLDVSWRNGVEMDDSVTDAAGVTAIKDAQYGGFCITEATEEGDWDGVTALTEDDDGVTICAVAGGEAEWEVGFTESFDKATWDLVKADTTGTDTAQLDNTLANAASVAGITEFALESRTDSNPYQYYQMWYKSQLIECPDDTDVDHNADFALREGQPFIFSLVGSSQSDNPARIQYTVDMKVHGSWVEETECVDDDDGDDFAVSSMVQATTALFLSFLALTSF